MATEACIAEALRFLQCLFTYSDRGHLNIWTSADKRSRWFPVSDLELAAETAIGASRTDNVYFGVGLHAKALGSSARGTASSVCALPGLYMEFDALHPAHTRRDLPPNLAAIKGLLQAFPYPPSLTIHSGHGLQSYWAFQEVWAFGRPEERSDAADLVRRLQHWFRREARENHWHVDNTSDLARVLRVPGTLNRKPGQEPVPVTILHLDEHTRYHPDHFDWLPRVEEPLWQSDDEGSDYPEADLSRILSGCGWMRHCKEDAKGLDEPNWYACLTILARCADGETAAHEFSRSYARYSQDETREKFRHAVESSKPRRCETIRNELDGQRYCSHCPEWGKVRSPIAVGMSTRINVRQPLSARERPAARTLPSAPRPVSTTALAPPLRPRAVPLSTLELPR
jgi:hypothetical protein